MHKFRIIDEQIISRYSSGNSVAERVKGLLAQQKENWELAKSNYSYLKNVRKKYFEFDQFRIAVQFNPGRMISSSAKVDTKSIEERTCFLCVENLPHEQRALNYNDEYLILVNPFPIFDEHFAIPTFIHQPQEIIDNFSSMLELGKDLGKYYSVFYNGPKCGASAPDHLHFQACTKNIMPIENELGRIIPNKAKVLYEGANTSVYASKNYLRNFFVIEADDKRSAISQFNHLQNAIKEVLDTSEEPMMNIIVLYETSWKILVFFREKHRPSQYFIDGYDRILISPAAVDFGGLLITPREEDFNKITKDDIKNIFDQTSISETVFNNIGDKYSNIARSKKA